MTDQKPRQWYQVRNAAKADTGTAELLIYDEIDSWFGVSAEQLARDIATLDDDRDLVVRINSPGGSAFDGVAILNALRGHPGNVKVIIDGLAASAASFIAMAGDEVVMHRNAEMMVHNAHGLVIGGFEDMRKMADTLERMNRNIGSIYADRAGGSVEDWIAVMAQETWFSADEAVDSGLADRVIESDPKSKAQGRRPVASFDRSRFRYQGRHAAPTPRVAAQAHTSTRKEGDMSTTDPRSIRSEDERTVDAAIRDGKILAADRQVWLNRLGEDRPNYTYLLNVIAPSIPVNRTKTAQRPDTTTTVDHTKLTNPTAQPDARSQSGFRSFMEASTPTQASDSRFELVESGRPPTRQESMEDMEYQLTNGRSGKPAPAHQTFIRDNNQPHLIEHADGTASWAPYTGTDL